MKRQLMALTLGWLLTALLTGAGIRGSARAGRMGESSSGGEERGQGRHYRPDGSGSPRCVNDHL